LAPSRTALSLRTAAIRIALLLIALLALPTVSRAHAETAVSLTFDDGIATQNTARTTLKQYGMHGTFYIISGLVGSSSYYMTWPQVDALAGDGNEIGGHTVDHLRLADLTLDQQRHEICDDAATLRGHGYGVTSFAYPHGSGVSLPAVRSLLQECGYHDARRVGDLRGPLCEDCSYAETIPPPDIWGIKSNEYITGPLTLPLLESYVTQAEANGGGWVPLMFHDICACADSSVSASDLSAFLAWLKARAPLGTVVKTMREVIDGTPPPPPPPPPTDTVAPTTSIKCNAAACSTGWYRQPVSVALAATDTGGSGVAVTRYTTDGTTPTASSSVYSGPLVLSQPTTIKYRSWDGAGNLEATRTTTIRVDTVAPTVAITSPANGSTLTANKQTTITAAAGDVGSGAKTVDFYVDGKRLGTDGLAPFSYGWKPTKGVHTLTAAVTDLAGNTATSAPVAVTVK
jgi:peptidoglycan/xylan/chitin deacetylase (PgdA/CDA1 family)